MAFLLPGSAKRSFATAANTVVRNKRYKFLTYDDRVNWLLKKYATHAALATAYPCGVLAIWGQAGPRGRDSGQGRLASVDLSAGLDLWTGGPMRLSTHPGGKFVPSKWPSWPVEVFWFSFFLVFSLRAFFSPHFSSGFSFSGIDIFVWGDFACFFA